MERQVDRALALLNELRAGAPPPQQLATILIQLDALLIELTCSNDRSVNEHAEAYLQKLASDMRALLRVFHNTVMRRIRWGKRRRRLRVRS